MKTGQATKGGFLLLMVRTHSNKQVLKLLSQLISIIAECGSFCVVHVRSLSSKARATFLLNLLLYVPRISGSGIYGKNTRKEPYCRKIRKKFLMTSIIPVSGWKVKKVLQVFSRTKKMWEVLTYEIFFSWCHSTVSESTLKTWCIQKQWLVYDSIGRVGGAVYC